MSMRNFVIIFSAVFCFTTITVDAATAKKAKPVPKAKAAKERTVTEVKNEELITPDNSYLGYYNPFYCFARGMNNLVSCGSEVPRCMIYNTVEAPWYGWFTGVFEGSGLVVCRALTGCLDIVTLGLTKSSVFSEKYPESPWDAIWIPSKPEPSPAMTNSFE